MSLEHLLHVENEDEILAKVQEESLRHYREIELPRLSSDESYGAVDVSKSPVKEDDGSMPRSSTSVVSGIVSIDAIGDASVLCTQVGGKAGALLFEGDEAKGFHLAAGSSYIYPTNYPIRQYQAAIVRSALFKNTLVSLPTGLGKTFIAAVVMYNFYRWYPRGKVVFMAPTRPLVAQQIKACYSIMGIPPDDTTEMTGVQATDIREKMWKEKRVFFLTPQVMANDLRSNICPASLVKCLVIDEAHKAVKDYAYCQVVKLLAAADCVYRTLALSATPGNDINAVIQVIRNLNISCLEMRGENSIDVAPYTHGKSIEPVVVDLSPELLRVKGDFMQVYERFARSLIENHALTSNIAFLSKFQILKALEKFRANPPRGMSTTLIGSLVSDFTMCMTFAHALELLQIYGLRAFYRYLADETGEKSKAATTRLRNNEDLQRLLKKLHEVLYPKPDSDVPYTWGHPKLKKLVTSLSDHFKSAEDKGEKTRAIIFCQYKVVVCEIVDLLSKCKPHVQAALFVGQSGGKERGMPQSKQLQIMKEFREGKINCLVATCVAEEGLDIGEVDLIILMESQKSPVRLVQRLGRTGRKRKGRCIVLLTKGKEEGKFHEAMASRKSYVQNIIDSKAVKNSLCQYSPPMFPPGTKPNQQLVHIKVTCVPTPSKPVKVGKKQMDIRDCAVIESRPFLNDEETRKIEKDLGSSTVEFNRLPSQLELWPRKSDPPMRVDELLNGDINQLSYWNDWNTEVHKSFVISNTLPSETYCHLMSYDADHEDEKYLKLIEAYDITANIPPPKGRKDGPSKANDVAEEEIEDEEGRKKSKKKPAPKKNYGQDIRSCMAAVVPKPHKRPRLDSTEDDIIILDADDDAPDCMEVEKGMNPPKMSECSALIENVNSASNASREGLDIAGIFGMDTDEFENVLYSDDMLCGLESNIGMCFRLGKLFSDPPVVPKPKCFDVDKFKFQCDQLLKLMHTVSVISYEPKATDLSFPLKQGFETISPTTIINSSDLEDKPVVVAAAKNDSFVDVDDLFGDDDCFHDVHTDVGSFQKMTNSPNQENAGTPVIEPKSICYSPIQKNNEFSSVWGSNSVFAELSPIGKAPPQVDRPIISSTPINPRKPSSRLVSTLAPLPKDEEWLLDDILEEDEDVVNRPENLKEHSSKDLFSKTPGSKVFGNVASASIPKASTSSKPKSDSDEDLWCLDDLFEDEMSQRDPKEETSLYGITQMVSQIERDKLKNRNVPIIESEMSSSKEVKKLPTVQTDDVLNVHHNESKLKSPSSLVSGMQANFEYPVPSSGQLVNRTPKNTTVSSIHILDSDSEDVIPHNNTGAVEESTAPKSTHKKIPIVAIDSDSCSPPISESRGEPSRNKPILPESQKVSSLMLDEDDDIFNMLCTDEFEENKLVAEKTNVIAARGNIGNPVKTNTSSAANKIMSSAADTIPSKRSSQSQNFKKFKRKSLLSHLDSEPENDFPPDKRDEASDETFNLRVGSSSKRKLSFEDLLGESNEAPSKYFATDVPKEPDKPPKKLSCPPVSAISTEKIPEPLQNSPSEEDIFIRPLAGKSTEKVSRSASLFSTSIAPSLVRGRSAEKEPQNEDGASSSSSTSPVKVLQKKKAKKHSKRKGHAFIENEADESGTISTDDSDNSSLDGMDDSFVDDESNHELSYSHYLKTVKSPIAGGKFKIPVNRRYVGDVYSQVVNDVDNEYENDSFCVNSDEGNSPEESTVLEHAERKLSKFAGPTKKRIVEPESGDSDCDERVADLNNLTALPIPNQKPKRRLLESDSDVTPERPPAKRPRNPIVSPMEGETTPKSKVSPPAAEFVVGDSKGNFPALKTMIPEPTVQIDSDSDEDLKKAIRLSVLESTTKKSAEERFEEDLQKALFLSQCEVAGPSKPLNNDNFPSPGDRGTSLLFMSQPILLDKKPLSTRGRTKTKTNIDTKSKGSKKVIELSDSD